MEQLSNIDPLKVREGLNWSQVQMAAYLDCHQSSVCRMENKGRVSRLFRREYQQLHEALERGETVEQPVTEAA